LPHHPRQDANRQDAYRQCPVRQTPALPSEDDSQNVTELHFLKRYLLGNAPAPPLPESQQLPAVARSCRHAICLPYKPASLLPVLIRSLLLNQQEPAPKLQMGRGSRGAPKKETPNRVEQIFSADRSLCKR